MVLDLFLVQRAVPDTYNDLDGGTMVDSIHAAIGFCRDIAKFPGLNLDSSNSLFIDGKLGVERAKLSTAAKEWLGYEYRGDQEEYESCVE